jgi:hypothetical protein
LSKNDHFKEENEFEINPVDDSPCKTYFYKPGTNKQKLNLLSKYASENKENIYELLINFFKYYAYEFDFIKSVISLENGNIISKIRKSESDGWPQHERLSIEDPFETWYVYMFMYI